MKYSFNWNKIYTQVKTMWKTDSLIGENAVFNCSDEGRTGTVQLTHKKTGVSHIKITRSGQPICKTKHRKDIIQPVP